MAVGEYILYQASKHYYHDYGPINREQLRIFKSCTVILGLERTVETMPGEMFKLNNFYPDVKIGQ